MDDKTLTCGKCGTPLEINAAHVTFKGGKKAYIKCPNPVCNNQRRIAYDLVEHLKPNSEAVKPIEEKGINPKEPVKPSSAEGEIPAAIQQALSEENNAPEPKKQEDSEGWGWALGGIAGLFGLGALIALARR